MDRHWIPAVLPAPLGNQSQPICWETLSGELVGTLPAALVTPLGAVSWSSRPEPCRLPAGSTVLPPPQPGSRGGSGSSRGKGLICTLWFGYLNTAVSAGVILVMFILCCEGDSRHM